MAWCERIIADAGPHVDVSIVCRVVVASEDFPVYSLRLGSRDAAVPAIGFFGGTHGLERIGTHVLLAFPGSLLARMRWDDLLLRQLESLRLVFMPLVNPVGMWRNRSASMATAHACSPARRNSSPKSRRTCWWKSPNGVRRQTKRRAHP